MLLYQAAPRSAVQEACQSPLLMASRGRQDLQRRLQIPGSKSNAKVVATTSLATPDKGKGHGNAQGVKRGSDFESDGLEGVRRRCSFASSASGAFMCYTVTQHNRFAIEVLDFCKVSMPQFAGEHAWTSSTPEPLGNHNLACLTQALRPRWCLLPHKAS